MMRLNAIVLMLLLTVGCRDDVTIGGRERVPDERERAQAYADKSIGLGSHCVEHNTISDKETVFVFATTNQASGQGKTTVQLVLDRYSGRIRELSNKEYEDRTTSGRVR